MAESWGENDKVVSDSSWGANDPVVKPKGPGIIRKAGDLAVGFAGGALGATKALTDVAGAGNAASNFLDSANKGVDSLLSQQAQDDRQEQSAIMKDAEGKGIYEGVKAGAKAFGVAPVQTAISGLGSVVPTVAIGLATGGAGAVASRLAQVGSGLAMGAGTTKGAIYDDIKRRSLESGMTPEAAEDAASRAQSYDGANADQIALGSVLGAADAATGVTPAVTNLLRRDIGRDAAKAAIGGMTGGVLARTAKGVLGEMPLEAAQGGQEQLAANIAAQRAGFQAGTWDNVASNATLEGLASAGPGGLFGALNKAPDQTNAPLKQDERQPSDTQLVAPAQGQWQAMNPDQAGGIDIQRAGQQWQDLGIEDPTDALQRQRGVEQVQSEREGAKASRLTDERINAVGRAWQDLGIETPVDALQRQRTWNPDGIKPSEAAGINPAAGALSAAAAMAMDTMGPSVTSTDMAASMAPTNPLMDAARLRIAQGAQQNETQQDNQTLDSTGIGSAGVVPQSGQQAAQNGARRGQDDAAGLAVGGVDQPRQRPAEMGEKDLVGAVATPGQTTPERQRALDRIASGKAWFGNAIKAQQFIHQNGLKDTHQAVKSGAKRWDIQAKATNQPTGVISVTQADQAIQAAPQQRPQAPAGLTDVQIAPQQPGQIQPTQATADQAPQAVGGNAGQGLVPATGAATLQADGVNLTRAGAIDDGPAVVLQNRDRSSAASIAQMNEIASAPDFLRAGASTVMDSGAPVVFGDTPADAVTGKEQQIVDGKGKRITAKYAIVEASDVLSSHGADGTPVSDYAQGKAGKLRAVAGNARTAGITEGYRRGTAEQYRADLEADAQSLGIDPKLIRSMKAPTLVRLMDKADVTSDIGDRSNIASAARMSAVEQSATDARRLDLTQLEFSDDGEPTSRAVIQFVRSMPTSEQGELVNPDGTPTRQAVDRLMAATFKQAYGSDELVRLYAQATDPESRTIMTALADSAGAMASLKDAGELDIRGAVAEAAGLALNARRKGEKLSDYLRTVDMTTSDEAVVVASFMADNIRSAKRIADGLREWAQYASEQAQIARDNEVQGGMFGAAPVASRADVFGRIGNGTQQVRAQQPARTGTVADGTQRQENDAGTGQAGAATGQQEAAGQQGAEEVLTSPTPADIEAQQDRAKAEQDKQDKARRDADARAAQDDERKRIAQASVAAADTFELGGDALDNITGQRSVFDAPEAAKPTYEPPPSGAKPLRDWIDQDDRRPGHPDYEQTQRQQAIMDAVGKALEDGVFYTSDLNPRIAKELGFDGPTGDGTDFSMDVYLARKAVEAKQAREKASVIAKELSLTTGDELGTLIFNDGKVVNKVSVGAIVDGGTTVVQITGKRGPVQVGATLAVDSIKNAIERAHERGKRKDSYADFISAKGALAQPQQSDRFYHRGDLAEYTGKTEQISGAAFHEFKYLEGAKKGETGVTQRAPDGSNPAQSGLSKATGLVVPQIATPSQLASFIGIAADDVTKLRQSDVDRVLMEAPAPFRDSLADHIKTSRPDLSQEVDDVMAEDRASKPAQGNDAGSKPIEDFGEKLPPARRALAKTLGENLSNDDIAKMPLSQIWPVKENEAIEDPFVAAVAHVMREAIPSKPRTSYKVKGWVEKVQILRNMAARIASGGVTPERFMELMADGYALRDLRSKIKLLPQIDRGQWSRIGDVQEWPDATDYVANGKPRPVPQAAVTIDGARHRLEGSGDIAKHLDAIKALLEGEAKESRLAFEIRGSGNAYFINKKGDKQYRHLMEFTTVKDARDALNNRYKDVLAAWEAVKERDNITERDLRSTENRPRTGKDWRKGKGVTEAEFQSQFGFRGGEFGKWVSQGASAQERQFFLNSTYDALMDLADIVGVPPRAISLEGSLGIAFGSRGSGWASAHFDPSNLVINLTKPRGAGALAHEWFHALDNYFARKRGGEVPMNGSQLDYRNSNYITHRTTPMMVRKDGRGSQITKDRLIEWRKSSGNDKYLAEDQWIEDPKHKQGVRAEVEERFENLVKTLNESPMSKRARLLDGVKESGDGYWSRTLERAARAFEGYVQSQMLAQGYHNDFLANVKDAVETGKNLARYPYLMPSEIAPVADAFASLFDTIKTKETEGGKLALYEPAASYNASYDTDLFGNPVPTATGRAAKAKSDSAGVRGDVQSANAIQDTHAPDGNYYVNTFVGTEVERELGASVIKTAQDAAKATQYLYKSAVERLDGIITDKDGKPLAVVGGFKGAVSQTSVYPSTLLAEAVRIEGAANIWLSHNHPSGKPTLSAADRALNATLASAFSGSGIEPRGLLAIAGDQFEFIDALGRIDQGESTIPKSVVRKRVPVIERQLQPGLQDRYPISSPVAARSVAGMLYDGAKQPGIMLLDSQNNLSAWVPIPDLMRGQLRGTGGLNAIYRAVSQSNASGAVIAHGGELDARVPMGGVSISENIAAALEKIEVRPLDSINVKTGKSAAESGLGVASGPVFSRQDAARAYSPAARAQAVKAVESTTNAIRGAWANAPEVIVAFDMQDPVIPEAVRKADEKQRSGGAKGAPEGFYFKGKVYLMASQIKTPQDAARVLFHEALGHHGLRGAFGKELDGILNQIVTMRRAEVDAKIKEYGLRGVNRLDRLAAAEEVLAEMAQKTPEIGFVKRAIAAIRAFFRKIGIRMSLSDNDIIANFILPARRFVEGGNGAVSRGSVAFARSMDQVDTPAFKAWFGDSKVVDAEGNPLVVYHGTPNVGFTEFDTGVVGAFFSDRFDIAASYAGRYNETEVEDGEIFADDDQGVYDTYLSIKNPLVVDWGGKLFADGPDGLRTDDFAARAKREGHDGLIIENVADVGPLSPGLVEDAGVGMVYVAFRPEQIKSASGNNGDFDPKNPDIRFSRAATANDLKQKATEFVNDFMNVPGKLSWWHKTVGTQYNLAQRSPQFRRVFTAVQNFINDVSYYATEAANKAPSLLPRLETWRDAIKSPVSGKDAKAISAPIFDGTLNWTRDETGQPIEAEDVQSAGIVWTTQELKDRFDLSDGQIKLYREFRESVDDSLSSLAKSHMLYLAGKDAADLKNAVMEAATVAEASQMLQDRMGEIAASGSSAEAAAASTTGANIIETEKQTQRLIQRGYAPLSRFGHHTLDVLVDGERQYFGLFESAKEAAEKERELRAKYPDADITRGTMSEQSYKLFAGVTPETAELFGEMMGVDDKEAFQEYIKLARSTRSAMRRMIQREGIEGFSEDAGRVLAGFVYSNARQASRNLHIGDMDRAASAIPKEQGELKDHAINLVQYIKNPTDEAQAIRGLLFAQYIGGSVASAMVNMTQPFTMSLPWLSQFGGLARAGKQMAAAVKDVGRHKKLEPSLAAALKRGEEDGTVSPQEVFDLMKQAQGRASLTSGDGTATSDAKAMANNLATRIGFGWGKMFSAAEQFNRRVTFIAAYRTAVEQGMADPDAFARQAIHETQGVYNRGNRPDWARGAVGGTLFTFKQYSIAYLEMLHRMAKRGAPGSKERAEGMRAVAYSIGVLLLMSGVGGAPGADDLDDLLSGLGQAMGYNFDSRSARRKYLTELFGDDLARFVERGVSGLPGAPIDVSGRLGMGNLIPGTGLLTKKQDHTRDVLEIAGPAGDLFARAFAAAGKVVQGDILGAHGAAATIAPRAAANLIQSGDMMATGMYRDRTGKKVVDTDTSDALSKALGFQPNAVKRVQDSTIEVQRMIGLNKLRETQIADKWAQGVFEKDQDKVKEAMGDLKRWNEDNPDLPIRIKFNQIRSRVETMNMDKAKRIAKTAPVEIRRQAREAMAQ